MSRTVKISGGFALLMAVLLYLDTQAILPWAILSCALHEGGHILAIRSLGGQVESFHLTVAGAEIIPGRNRLFSYWEEVLIALAGPAVSLGLAVLFAFCGATWGSTWAYLMAGLNAAVGLFNLIPAMPLDGGRLLKLLISMRHTPFIAEKICVYMTKILGLVLLPLGVTLMIKGNFSLLLSALWLLAGCAERGNV